MRMQRSTSKITLATLRKPIAIVPFGSLMLQDKRLQHYLIMPGMGRIYESDDDDITNLRKWAVKGFKQYLIFYRYDDETLEILRVLHAARDLEPLLKDL